MSTLLLPWLHILGVILMSGGIVAELYLLKLAPTAETVRLIPRVDRFYFIGVIVVLVTGLGRMFHGGKGLDYYLHTGAFHGALTLFVLAAIVSIPPTVRYIRWRRAFEAGGRLPDAAAWSSTKLFVHLQLGAFAVIALLMTMTARGFGTAS